MPMLARFRFSNGARIGFQAVIINNDPAASEVLLDRAYQALRDGLWSDPHLTNPFNNFKSAIPYNVHIESVTRGVRKHKWGTIGLNNETPIAELQYDATVFYRESFRPRITDELLQINVTTQFPSGGSPEQIAATQQVVVDYSFTPFRKGENHHGQTSTPDDAADAAADAANATRRRHAAVVSANDPAAHRAFLRATTARGVNSPGARAAARARRSRQR